MTYIVFWHRSKVDGVIHVELMNEYKERIDIWDNHLQLDKKDDVLGYLSVFKLPISFSSIATKRKELGRLTYPRSKDRARDPLDFPYLVYTKKSMSCSQLTAYLLGLDEYWFYKPDDLYKLMCSYVNPLYNKCWVKRWK